jgi:PHD/YefM family antitoxin component YafN of YafNO toxin-antitoxin module
MQKNEVPQDEALFDGMSEVCYAVDETGRYVLAESAGWEPANIANIQAWEVIRSEVEAVRSKVHAGELSPLAYQMARNQMDAKLLSGYAGLFCWQVRRHMKPEPFSKLNPARLVRYAAIFKISVEELCRIPESSETGDQR